MFTCRIWGLRSTDLNQGVVYGIHTDQTRMSPSLNTSFHYDHIFGTVLNRFCVQAVIGMPLTVYGKGGQTRGFLDIRDTIQCVDLAVNNPAAPGEFRVFNQFTEQFSVNQLSDIVSRVARKKGYAVRVDHIDNPRIEMEEHYYNAKHTKLLDLGLKPHLLSEDLVGEMIDQIDKVKHLIDPHAIKPSVKWRQRG